MPIPSLSGLPRPLRPRSGRRRSSSVIPGRIPAPDRIFFDIYNTKLAPELMGKSFDVNDGFLRKVRVAQYQRGLTRVVLEVDDVADYSAFLLPNPYRLIIDIHGKKTPSQVAANTAQPAAATTENSSPAPTKAEVAKPNAAELKATALSGGHAEGLSVIRAYTAPGTLRNRSSKTPIAAAYGISKY